MPEAGTVTVVSKVPEVQILGPLGRALARWMEDSARRSGCGALTTPGLIAAPKQKLTLPKGVFVGVGEIVAVNVTDCPTIAGFGEAPTVTVVAAGGMPSSGTVADRLDIR